MQERITQAPDLTPDARVKVSVRRNFHKIILDCPGILDCRVPPHGEIREGLHVHIGRYLTARNGSLIKIPIDKLEINGWVIRKADTAYDGTLLKQGEAVRIADTRKCLPTDENKIPCGRDYKGRITRNDIPNPYVEYPRS